MCGASPSGRRVPRHDVERRRRGHCTGERQGEREQSGGPPRLPDRDQQPYRQRRLPRAELVRGVHRSCPGSRRATPGRRGRAPVSATHSSTYRGHAGAGFGLAAAEDRRTEVGYRLGRSDAQPAVECVDRTGECGTPRTARDVGIDHRTLEGGGLTVCGRGDRLPDFFTPHVLVVAGGGREFPMPAPAVGCRQGSRHAGRRRRPHRAGPCGP